MKTIYSCQEAIAQCLENKRFAVAHLMAEEKTMAMHIHDCYEIYYSISGAKQFLIDSACYSVAQGDLFLINNYESHCLSSVEAGTHERIVISVHPDYLKALSSPETDLTLCFRLREGGTGCKLSLSPEDRSRFMYLVRKLQKAEGYGADLMENAVFTELMVMAGSLIKAQDNAPAYRYHPVAEQIVSYINSHITERITLNTLAESLFLSPAFLCRVFKAETGTTINKYITARRVSIAKAHLSAGRSVAEACGQSGFNDYTNFVTLFTRLVGVTPKQYALRSAG